MQTTVNNEGDPQNAETGFANVCEMYGDLCTEFVSVEQPLYGRREGARE
jgi:hypothetical protein